MVLATGGRRNPVTKAVLAVADDLDGTDELSVDLDLTGAGGCIIIQQNNGTAGTTGIDLIQFSKDGGSTWAAATAANLGNRHLGLLTDAGEVVSGAALNAAGTEGDAVFVLGPTKGPFMIRVSRATAWTTGAPTVVAYRIG